MKVQNIQKQSQNFKGVRVPAGETYQRIFPKEVVGIRSFIDSLEKRDCLTKRQASALKTRLGNDDIHMETPDLEITELARENNWIFNDDNFKVLKKVIQKSTILPKETIEALCKGTLDIKLKTINAVAPLQRQIGEINERGQKEIETLVNDTVESVRKAKKSR